jgi:Mg2+/Co2+ transporter CorB
MKQKVTIHRQAIIILQNTSGLRSIWRHCVTFHRARPPSFMILYRHYYDNVATVLQINEVSNFQIHVAVGLHTIVVSV